MADTNKRNKSIGVFDSGLGGLTVVKALRQQLSHETIVYFGDTARVPYGTKSSETVIRFSRQNARLLMTYDIKMLVVACNTSSSVALNVLRKEFPVPVVGVIEPGAKKAVAVTKNKIIGVIATTATIKSGAYLKAIKRLGKGLKVISQACPLFVPLVEEGWIAQKETISIAKRYLADIMRKKADTLVLGCTHYPLLKKVLQKIVGTKVYLVDSAQEVASEVKGILKKSNLLREKGRPSYRFLVSDEPEHFRKLARRFLGNTDIKVKRVNIF